VRDDPLPDAEEAIALMERAARRLAADPELREVVEEMERALAVLRRQEWGQPIERKHREEEPRHRASVEAR
jgi:hypothetical protein